MSTLKDISQLSGVSLTTVSRALSNCASVNSATKEKVLSAAAELNYTPNFAARSLRTKDSGLIGIISEGNTNYMFSHLINYASDYCIGEGYCLVTANHHNDPETEEKVYRAMRERGVKGLIISLVSRQSKILPDIIRSDIPIVVFDRFMVFEQTSMGEKNYSITLDNYNAGRMAARYLLDKGHSKIAVAQGPAEVELTVLRTSGFLEELNENGVSVPAKYRIKSGFEFQDGCRTADILLKQGDLPTAIWAQNDLMAAGIISELTVNGIKVPEQVAVLGMDGIALAETLSPTLSTIAQPYQKMAVSAVNMILGKYPGEKATFEPKLIERHST